MSMTSVRYLYGVDWEGYEVTVPAAIEGNVYAHLLRKAADLCDQRDAECAHVEGMWWREDGDEYVLRVSFGSIR